MADQRARRLAQRGPQSLAMRVVRLLEIDHDDAAVVVPVNTPRGGVGRRKSKARPSGRDRLAVRLKADGREGCRARGLWPPPPRAQETTFSRYERSAIGRLSWGRRHRGRSPHPSRHHPVAHLVELTVSASVGSESVDPSVTMHPALGIKPDLRPALEERRVLIEQDVRAIFAAEMDHGIAVAVSPLREAGPRVCAAATVPVVNKCPAWPHLSSSSEPSKSEIACKHAGFRDPFDGHGNPHVYRRFRFSMVPR